MASSRYHSFVNFLLFCVILQKHILNSGADEQCLNPTFGKNQKVVIDYFYSVKDTVKYHNEICEIVNNSNGLVSMVYRMCSPMTEKETCAKDDNCLDGRIKACFYQYDAVTFNTCNVELPDMNPTIADCVCAGSADDILIANDAALNKFGIQNTPALIVDNNYDSCFKDYSSKSMKEYFCKAYNKGLPICQK